MDDTTLRTSLSLVPGSRTLLACKPRCPIMGPSYPCWEPAIFNGYGFDQVVFTESPTTVAAPIRRRCGNGTPKPTS